MLTSSKRPVGSPERRSLTITPPFGFGVSFVTPAIFSATLFATKRCPDVCTIEIGCSVDAVSRSSRVGWRFSRRSVWSYPRPMTHCPFAVSSALRFNAAIRSSMVRTVPTGGLWRSTT